MNSKVAHHATIVAWQSHSGRALRSSRKPPACTLTTNMTVLTATSQPALAMPKPLPTRNDGRNDNTIW